jgi:cell volume regulation protein A
MTFREKAMVSWVGLRGAVPIILATFPLLAGIPKADVIFNIVFFIVLTSALLQGATIPLVARWLRVDAPISVKAAYPIECEPTGKMKCDMEEVRVPANSIVSDKRILELGLPDGALVVLIKRDDEFFVPVGGTVLREGDSLLVLADKDAFNIVRSIVNTQTVKPE